MKQNPRIEKIDPGFGSSLLVKQYIDPCKNQDPFWHIHPELELVYVNGGSGKRHIGNQLSNYTNGDLILIGSNLPHSGFTDRLTGNKSETVVQMPEHFLGQGFLDIPEMAPIKKLFERSKQGMTFHGRTKRKVGAKMEKLPSYDQIDRVIKLINIFKQLALSDEYILLNAHTYSMEIQAQDNQRINKVYDHVRHNFKRTISLDEIADLAGMTVPAFCRYFKKISNKTFTHFVNEYRLVHAIKLLSDGQIGITEVCYSCGFNNFSHFNKQFKLFTGKSPSAYRKELSNLIK